MAHCQRGNYTLVSSGVIEIELSKIKDVERLEQVQTLLVASSKRLNLTTLAEEWAIFFQQHGLKPFDSLHVSVKPYP